MQAQLFEKLESAQEVGLPNSLSAGISGTLRDLGTLVETLRRLVQDALGRRFAAVVFGRGDIGGVVVDGDLRREEGSASRHLLLVALALFLVQS